MDTTEAPQIITHLQKSIGYTPFDTKWIPQTAKFVVSGQTPKMTGIMEIYQLNKTELSLVKEFNIGDKGIKCATFGACPTEKSEIAFGTFDGNLIVYDIEKQKEVFKVKAHEGIINCIDGIGGQEIGYGAPEILTGGRDGCVRVWDIRQNSPVLSLEPVEKESVVPDCWSVGFGNSFNNDERVLAAGYDNGDIKFFDLRTNNLLWDTNIQNGVCGLEFDRKDIIMNKLVASTLEGRFYVFDLRTLNPTTGYTYLKETVQKGSTIWGIKHVPQNRELFITQNGSGGANLYRYHYPKERQMKDSENRPKGVVGTVELLNEKEVCQQPISSFDWNKDKLGLGALCGLDQTIKVVIVTKLNLY